jgi:hypothetical protein
MSESEIAARMTEDASILSTERVRDAIIADPDITSRRTTTLALWKRVFSFPAMLGALLVGGVATIARAFFVDPDVWWHIKLGQVILATHRWPTADTYSFSVAGHHWIDSEWIAEVVLATMYRLGGMRGLELLLLVLGSAILIALYTLGTIRSGNSKAGFLAAAAVFVLAAPSFNLRPQMLGYLFLTLTLIALERFRQGKRRTAWMLPILMLIWVNAHGSWTIGLGVIAVYLATGLVEFHVGDIEARRWSPSDRLGLAAILVLCACVTVITPYGASLAKFPLQFASSLPVSLTNIKEWLPMPFGDPLGKLFLVAVMGVIVLQITNQLKWRLEDIALFIFAVTVACLHRRFLLIFVPILTPLIASVLARWVPHYERAKDKSVINAALMAAILAILIWYFPTEAELWQTTAKTYPVAAVEYLNNHSVPGPMYNTYDFGGYLILARGPENKVFLDGRSELYEPGGVLADYFAIADVKPGALSTLEKYGFHSCLLERDEGLATVLAALPGWREVYEDETSILFVRRSDSPASGIRKSGTTEAFLHQGKEEQQ